jgi:hypothetical protein
MEAAGSFDHWYLPDYAVSPLPSILQKKGSGSFEAAPVY